MDKVVEILQVQLMLTTLISSFEVQTATAKYPDKKEADSAVKEIFRKHAQEIISTLDTQGFTVVPKERIPDAFLK